jgi:hypothetical protein
MIQLQPEAHARCYAVFRYLRVLSACQLSFLCPSAGEGGSQLGGIEFGKYTLDILIYTTLEI